MPAAIDIAITLNEPEEDRFSPKYFNDEPFTTKQLAPPCIIFKVIARGLSLITPRKKS